MGTPLKELSPESPARTKKAVDSPMVREVVQVIMKMRFRKWTKLQIGEQD